MFESDRGIGPDTPNLDAALQNTVPVEEALSRCTLLQALALGAAAFMVADKAANFWQEEVYGSHGTSLRMDGGEHIESKFLTVSFGGLGNHDDYYGAATLYKASGRRIPAGDMMYDDIHGIDTDDMARVLHKAQKARGFEYLILNLDSLGALFGLEAAYKAGIPIAGMVINCGPAKLDDATTGPVFMADIVTSPALPHGTLVANGELVIKNLVAYFRDTSNKDWLSGLPAEIASLPSQMTAGAAATLQRHFSAISW